jgi:hypothetical protein
MDSPFGKRSFFSLKRHLICSEEISSLVEIVAVKAPENQRSPSRQKISPQDKSPFKNRSVWPVRFARSAQRGNWDL